MVQDIDVKKTEELMQAGATVLDVLGHESYEKRHLPGAKDIPVSDPDFEEKVADAVPDKSSPVIVYCSDPGCQASPKAARKLEELGYTNVYDFDAGLQGWRKAGNEFEGKGLEEVESLR